MAPEYALQGYLTDKADVYSFGIVALEIVSGQCNTVHRHGEESLYILEWVKQPPPESFILIVVSHDTARCFVCVWA